MNIRHNHREKENKISLYNLIEAVEDATSPNERDIVPIVVKDLLDSGKVKLTCTYDDCSQLLN